MTDEPMTASFVLTRELKQLVQQWAAANDRTQSAELRQILTQEAQRRQRQPSRREVEYRTN